MFPSQSEYDSEDEWEETSGDFPSFLSTMDDRIGRLDPLLQACLVTTGYARPIMSEAERNVKILSGIREIKGAPVPEDVFEAQVRFAKENKIPLSDSLLKGALSLAVVRHQNRVKRARKCCRVYKDKGLKTEKSLLCLLDPVVLINIKCKDVTMRGYTFKSGRQVSRSECPKVVKQKTLCQGARSHSLSRLSSVPSRIRNSGTGLARKVYKDVKKIARMLTGEAPKSSPTVSTTKGALTP